MQGCVLGCVPVAMIRPLRLGPSPRRRLESIIPSDLILFSHVLLQSDETLLRIDFQLSTSDSLAAEDRKRRKRVIDLTQRCRARHGNSHAEYK